MTTRVAFLRAVNVGKRTVKMSRLVEIFEELGFEDVWTYINSGNVVFDAPGSRGDLEKRIGAALEAEYGFEVTTFVRTAAEIRKVLAAEPFTLADGDTYFVTFLQAKPTAAAAKEFEASSNDFDTVKVVGTEVHWLMHGKSIDTTLGNKKWKPMGEFSTSRNTTMLRKLSDKIAAR
jgi:uncharacterized protein (DUF1697 family)